VGGFRPPNQEGFSFSGPGQNSAHADTRLRVRWKKQRQTSPPPAAVARRQKKQALEGFAPDFFTEQKPTFPGAGGSPFSFSHKNIKNPGKVFLIISPHKTKLITRGVIISPPPNHRKTPLQKFLQTNPQTITSKS
jgi:hypothetical protein